MEKLKKVWAWLMCKPNNGLPKGFIRIDEKLPEHRQNVKIYLESGAIIDCKFYNRLFKLIWDSGDNDHEGEEVLGWKAE